MPPRRTLTLSLLAAVLLPLASCSGKRLPETCYLKPESGQCRAAFKRWYLDDRTGVCKAFIWGGCGGVAPFETEEACAAMCMPGKTPAMPLAAPVQPSVVPAPAENPQPVSHESAGTP